MASGLTACLTQGAFLCHAVRSGMHQSVQEELPQVWFDRRPPCTQSFTNSARAFYKAINFARWINDFTFKPTLQESWLAKGNCFSFAWGMRMEYAHRYQQVPNGTENCVAHYVGAQTIAALAALSSEKPARDADFFTEEGAALVYFGDVVDDRIVGQDFEAEQSPLARRLDTRLLASNVGQAFQGQSLSSQSDTSWPSVETMTLLMGEVKGFNTWMGAAVPDTYPAWQSIRENMYAAFKQWLFDSADEDLYGMIEISYLMGAHVFALERHGTVCSMLTANGDGGGELAFSPALMLIADDISEERLAGRPKFEFVVHDVAKLSSIPCSEFWTEYWEKVLRITTYEHETDKPSLQHMQTELEEKAVLSSLLSAHSWDIDKAEHPWAVEWSEACVSAEGCAKALDNPPVLMTPFRITWVQAEP